MTDAYGRNIPGDDETPDLPKLFEDFSLSMPPGPKTVSSRAEANAIRIAAGNPVGFHVWRADTNQEERWNGSSWEYVAGRRHAATVNFARNGIAASSSNPLVLYATDFVRSSVGWTISGPQNLVIPQTGVYAISFSVNVSGSASTMGRAFFQFSTTNGAFGNRWPAYNEDNWGGAILHPLSIGNELRVQVWHESGGTRNWSGQLNIFMLGDPNWVTH